MRTTSWAAVAAVICLFTAGCGSRAAVDDGLWTRTDGEPTVEQVRTFAGPEHCGWQDVTFLLVGPETSAQQYLREPVAELAQSLRTTYDADAELPADAEDTGWRHDGRELWLAANGSAAYLVAEDEPEDVERWPATRGPVACA